MELDGRKGCCALVAEQELRRRRSRSGGAWNSSEGGPALEDARLERIEAAIRRERGVVDVQTHLVYAPQLTRPILEGRTARPSGRARLAAPRDRRSRSARG